MTDDGAPDDRLRLTAQGSTPVQWIPVYDDHGPLYPFVAPMVGDRIPVYNVDDAGAAPDIDGRDPDLYVYVTAVTAHPDGAGYVVSFGPAPV